MRLAALLSGLVLSLAAPAALACSVAVYEPQTAAERAKLAKETADHQRDLSLKLRRNSDVVAVVEVLRADDDLRTGRTLHLKRVKALRGAAPRRVVLKQKSSRDRGVGCGPDLLPDYLIAHPRRGDRLVVFATAGRRSFGPLNLPGSRLRVVEVVEAEGQLGRMLLRDVRAWPARGAP